MRTAAAIRVARAGSLAGATVGLAAGLIAQLADARSVANGCWIATSALGILLSAVWVLQSAKARRLGVDVIALVALVGTLTIGQHLAGAVITVMLTTGRSLEGWAAGRAERELRALLEHGPRIAHRYRVDGMDDCPLDAVKVGDLLLVLPGEVIPVDGSVTSTRAVVDESALTGEPMPVSRERGDAVRSGAVNAGAPFELVATTSAAESTFAGIVRLVEQASAATSPFVRLADRFALAFLVVSFTLAGAAWLISGDEVRAVAVLVVATPCPLILAAPVAIVAGLSRCARRGVVVKGGGALEMLASADVLLFDKTGTLTVGRPTITEIVAAPGFDGADMLRLAASLEQVSPHVLARTIVDGARQRGCALSVPTETSEQPGAGVTGSVDGRDVRVGNGRWAGIAGDERWVVRARSLAEFGSASCVFVAVDDQPAGALILSDLIRPDAARTIRRLRRSGIRRVVMVTGDRADVASSIGSMLAVDDVVAEQSPADKVNVIRRETARGCTIMVGDGINDAPALAAASVGVAMGARGTTASSEAADIVLTVDRLDRLGEAHLIARRARAIAMQSVVIGMTLSLGAMVAAAAGLLAPTAGAILQEVIDVSVILNALRALRGGNELRLDQSGSALANQFATAHRVLRPDVALLRDAADSLGLGAASGADAMVPVRRAHRLLVEDIGPHEEEEDRLLYPVIAGALGGADPMATMSRAHAEIGRLTGQLGMVIQRVGRDRPTLPDIQELQRLLYGLYALLELHFAQEDESFLSLVDEQGDDRVHARNRHQ